MHPMYGWILSVKLNHSMFIKLGLEIVDPRVITLWLSAGRFEFLHRQQADDQMIEGSAGAHIRAEFYLEGYGWIPVDVPAAE